MKQTHTSTATDNTVVTEALPNSFKHRKVQVSYTYSSLVVIVTEIELSCYKDK